jgi:hypothetical protein
VFDEQVSTVVDAAPMMPHRWRRIDGAAPMMPHRPILHVPPLSSTVLLLLWCEHQPSIEER